MSAIDRSLAVCRYVVQSWIHHALVERYEMEGLAVHYYRILLHNFTIELCTNRIMY